MKPPPVRRPRGGFRGVLDDMARDLNEGRIPPEERKRHRDAMRELRGFLDAMDPD